MSEPTKNDKALMFVHAEADGRISWGQTGEIDPQVAYQMLSVMHDALFELAMAVHEKRQRQEPKPASGPRIPTEADNESIALFCKLTKEPDWLATDAIVLPSSGKRGVKH